MEPAIRVGADARDELAARPAQTGENMNAEHQGKAERENGHGDFLLAAAGRICIARSAGGPPWARGRIASDARRAVEPCAL